MKKVYEGVHIGNYVDPSRDHMPEQYMLSGVVVCDPDDYTKTRHMFHPYTGQPPIHCAPPAGYRTYHNRKGYAGG